MKQFDAGTLLYTAIHDDILRDFDRVREIHLRFELAVTHADGDNVAEADDIIESEISTITDPLPEDGDNVAEADDILESKINTITDPLPEDGDNVAEADDILEPKINTITDPLPQPGTVYLGKDRYRHAHGDTCCIGILRGVFLGTGQSKLDANHVDTAQYLQLTFLAQSKVEFAMGQSIMGYGPREIMDPQSSPQFDCILPHLQNLQCQYNILSRLHSRGCLPEFADALVSNARVFEFKKIFKRE